MKYALMSRNLFINTVRLHQEMENMTKYMQGRKWHFKLDILYV